MQKIKLIYYSRMSSHLKPILIYLFVPTFMKNQPPNYVNQRDSERLNIFILVADCYVKGFRGLTTSTDKYLV